MRKREIERLCHARASYMLRFAGREAPWWALDANEILSRIKDGKPWEDSIPRKSNALFSGNERPLTHRRKSCQGSDKNAAPLFSSCIRSDGKKSRIVSEGAKKNWPNEFELQAHGTGEAAHRLFLARQYERSLVPIRIRKSSGYVPDARVWQRITPEDDYYLHTVDNWVYYFDRKKGEFRPSFPKRVAI